MPTHTQEMSELNHNLCHCTQQVTKEMTRLNGRVPQDMPSVIAYRKEMTELNPNLCPRLPHVAKERKELNSKVGEELNQ